ncbi:MAG TPA: hypothetical protein VJX67_20645 [Blastocatellia bacterium]|nr:hypothetical protein [Blastocatellia bacterium]
MKPMRSAIPWILLLMLLCVYRMPGWAAGTTSAEIHAKAATTVQNPDIWSWTKIQPEGEEFSARMPSAPSIGSEQPAGLPTGRSYSSTDGQAIYKIVSFRTNGAPEQRIETFANRFKQSFRGPGGSLLTLTFERNVPLDGCRGRQYGLRTAAGMQGLLRMYATWHAVYLVEVLGGSESDAGVAAFLSAFRLDRKEPGPDTSGSPQTPGPEPTNTRFPPSPASAIDQCNCDYSQDHDVVLCEQPQPIYTDQMTGKVKLHVRFSPGSSPSSDRQVIILGVTEGEGPMVGLAMDAVKKIVFCPAVQDGKLVPQEADIEYGPTDK